MFGFEDSNYNHIFISCISDIFLQGPITTKNHADQSKTGCEVPDSPKERKRTPSIVRLVRNKNRKPNKRSGYFYPEWKKRDPQALEEEGREGKHVLKPVAPTTDKGKKLKKLSM